MIQRTLVLLIAVMPAFTCGCASAPNVRTAPSDSVSRVAIMSAFDEELKVLRTRAEIVNARVINGRTYYIGRIDGRRVVMVLSGKSMVNAAMTTQTLLDHFNIQSIVFSGIAGGVNPELKIGDVVIPAQWGQYQEHLIARKTEEGWDVEDHRPEFGNFGMMFPRKVSVSRKNAIPDKEERIFWFPADSAMLRVAGMAAGKAQLKRCTPSGDCLETDPRVVVGGNGVSGSSFVDNAEYRRWVWSTFAADALDMETAAVAHVAYTNDVPFVAFRSLSDLAGGGPGKNEVDIFFELAAENSAAVVLAFLQVWGQPSIDREEGVQ